MSKKNKLTREQAEELYKDLQTTVAALRFKGAVKNPVAPKSKEKRIKPSPLKGYSSEGAFRHGASNAVAAEIAQTISESLSGDRAGMRSRSSISGQRVAFACVIFFAVVKVVLSALEASGVATAAPAMATMASSGSAPALPAIPSSSQSYSKEELHVLSALDARRVELEERNRKLDEKGEDIDRREREFAVKLTELRELTDALKNDREKSDKKRSVQLDQLANVYSAMDPKEAAALIEQLDVTIALELVSRMPEKRIGQILGLMNSGKALAITRLLSGR